ncbi:hypothetical protein [Runella slithyformis]|uniref:Uncharacterized protein n=1 Tax=Runella slithyformis (strain ATCC 29530 / DSM 19594 / LMG 11500 / NCIMB 11436 / LSU 4) TaxID=761193 RepID=A0A7U3ZHR1_RUNSL|nr:hypothetical protein [Runella slithyformis]AEI47438.1 hypothetical protein Runsl_1007 [Runella slithyformis DSM 19594]
MATQLTITIEESLLNALGKTEIERSLQEWLTKLQLRTAAKEILEDTSEFDLTNDPQWQVARELAWQQEKSNYSV